ncbi:hypothetical protein VNO77_31472 [Canavalia gladiata]|uniref:Uncharacterized protein n=1 Tax=Canavalia gladiata TaxID=3824 RepID=A0AAN9Q7Q8_CANGL
MDTMEGMFSGIWSTGSWSFRVDTVPMQIAILYGAYRNLFLYLYHGDAEVVDEVFASLIEDPKLLENVVGNNTGDLYEFNCVTDSEIFSELELFILTKLDLKVLLP